MNEVDPELTIGAFARRSRLSTKAVRLYESAGVLAPASVDEVTGYRRYRESQLREARFVRMLRRLDMPLATVAVVVAAPRSERDGLIELYWTAVRERHIHQLELADHLLRTLSGGKDSYPMYDIRTRDVPEQTMLTEQSHVTADALPAWITRALDRQRTALDAVGGAVGAPIVKYHGEVNEDSDGPVEALSPIDPARVGDVALPTRVEPAHREAYATITKAQVRYPDILSAYDAVESWIAANGERIVGSPREVYFTDFAAAAPDDPVVDIAFVIAPR